MVNIILQRKSVYYFTHTCLLTYLLAYLQNIGINSHITIRHIVSVSYRYWKSNIETPLMSTRLQCICRAEAWSNYGGYVNIV